MRILVLIKPVAQIESAKFNEDYSIQRERSRHTISFADEYALSLARRLKQNSDSCEIILMSMASEGQSALLDSLKVYDIDSLYHLCDREFAKSDTLATAYILAEAINNLGSFDLILAGQQSTDSETGQVPAQVATLLEIPYISSVSDFSIDKEKIYCIRYVEDERQKIVGETPLCLALLSKGSELTPPSIRALRKARQVPTIRLSNQDLNLPKSMIGLTGSPTYVIKSKKNQFYQREPKWIRNAEEGAQCIYNAITEVLSGTSEHINAENTVAPISFDDDVPVMVLGFTFDKTSMISASEILSQTTLLGRPARLLTIGEGLTKEQIIAFTSAGATAITSILASNDLDEVAYASIVEQYLDPSVTILLAGATVQLRSCMSILAAMTRSGLAADCTNFSYEEDRLSVSRPTFGGNLEAIIGINSALQMATIRPKTFAARSFASVGQPSVKIYNHQNNKPQTTILSREKLETELISNLPIIFSIGNGVQDPTLRERIFAFGFRKGASRIAVNAYGYDYSIQIGQTGHFVDPRLYVSFGIHGAFQHVIGIKQSQQIIAVNIDPKAPIFDYANIAICCDVEDVVTHLERLWQNNKGLKEQKEK
jgi:electron transfer flavoprotein alpha subunit